MVVFSNDEDNYYCSVEYDTGLYKQETIINFFNCFNEISDKLSKITNYNEVKISQII